jgi:tetratricopeptide (TPR) repeat protein
MSSLAGLRWTIGSCVCVGMIAAPSWPASFLGADEPVARSSRGSTRNADASTQSEAADAPKANDQPPRAKSPVQLEPDLPACLPQPRWHWLPPKSQTLILRLDPDYGWAERCMQDRSLCPPGSLSRLFGKSANRLDLRADFLNRIALALEPRISSAVRSGRQDVAERLQNDQVRFRAGAEDAYRRALTFYQASLDLPQNPELDETLAALGGMHYRMGKLGLAIQYYGRLIRDVPSSSLVPLSHLAIGEIRFVLGDWKGADQSLAMALSFPSSQATPCALYMQAWEDFERGFIFLARKSFAACWSLRANHSTTDSFVDHVSAKCAADAARLGLSE